MARPPRPAPVRRVKPKKRRAARPRFDVVLRPITPLAAGPILREPPHAHAVCRVCGKISEVPFVPAEGENLRALAADRPDGWTIDGISLSLMGICPRCRIRTPPR